MSALGLKTKKWPSHQSDPHVHALQMVSHLTVDIFTSVLFIAIFQWRKLRLKWRMKFPRSHQEHVI